MYAMCTCARALTVGRAVCRDKCCTTTSLLGDVAHNSQHAHSPLWSVPHASRHAPHSIARNGSTVRSTAGLVRSALGYLRYSVLPGRMGLAHRDEPARLGAHPAPELLQYVASELELDSITISSWFRSSLDNVADDERSPQVNG